jgi:hypothetical protein
LLYKGVVVDAMVNRPSLEGAPMHEKAIEARSARGTRVEVIVEAHQTVSVNKTLA